MYFFSVEFLEHGGMELVWKPCWINWLCRPPPHVQVQVRLPAFPRGQEYRLWCQYQYMIYGWQERTRAEENCKMQQDSQFYVCRIPTAKRTQGSLPVLIHWLPNHLLAMWPWANNLDKLGKNTSVIQRMVCLNWYYVHISPSAQYCWYEISFK